MCGICGCSEGQHTSHAHHHQPSQHHEADHVHDPSYDPPPHHRGGAETHHDHDHTLAHHHAADASATRRVQVERDILAENNRYAAANRRYLSERGILALNLVSSPGSGKTTLLVETIARLQGERDLCVIEGDQQTSRDAERIRATGVKALQINTGKGCHLDAHRVGHALSELAPAPHSVVFIENVGNLVCPAMFDLGEAHKVVVLSVTEGEDKPIKYPDMFHAADLLLLNKIDLLPYVDFDPAQCIAYAKQVNPKIRALTVSAKTGQGMEQWLQWLRAELALLEIAYA